MMFSWRVPVCSLTLLAALSGGGCAHASPIPTGAMARAASELHVAEQAGANHAPDSRRLWLDAEAALEEARGSVFRGRHDAARAAAQRALRLAHQARELSELRAPGEPARRPGTTSLAVTGLAGLAP